MASCCEAVKVVISDDLTGAMDAGVQLAKKGWAVSVAVEKTDIGELGRDNDVVVIDTESRNVPPGEAYEKIRENIVRIHNAGAGIVYKKIDSTLRGNIGRELAAVLENTDFQMVAFAPALPFNGRTTNNGYHYLNNKLLTESDLSRDPFSPVKSSYIPEIIKYQTSVKARTVTLHEVRQGPGYIGHILDRLYHRGFRIAVFDAGTEEDLKLISEGLARCSLKVLPCGSAGLFSMLFAATDKKEAVPGVYPAVKNGPVLVISGSPAKASKLQIDSAKRSGLEVIKLDSAKIIKREEARSAELERVRKLALEGLKQGKDMIIDGAGEGKTELYEIYKDTPQVLLEHSAMIQEALSEIIKNIYCEARLAGLMIIGGDTAVSICRKLNVKGLKIVGEVEPFVPSGFFISHECGDLPVVTKAGGFGTEDVIIKTIKYFRGGNK